MTDSTSTGTPTPAPSPRKKRSLGKLIFRLFGVLVLLVVLALAGLYVFRNTLVRTGVVRGGQYATDQKTVLDAANLSLFGGTLDLNTLKIANPTSADPKPTYKEPNFLTMKTCLVDVNKGSLLSNTIVVNKIEIKGLEIFLEQNGMKNNLAEIMDIIKSKTSAASSNSSNKSPGKSLKITVLSLIGTKVHLRGLVAMDLDLGDITINDPTNPDGRPMKIADVIGKVLLHVAQQIVNNPNLPPVFKDGLKDVSKLVDNMKENLTKGVQEGLNAATMNIQDLTKGIPDLGKGIPNLGKDAGKGIDDVTKGLQNLIPGQKPPATKP